MDTPPETRYARNGDVHLAYQVVGDGPFDLVFAPPAVSHIEAIWEDQDWAAFFGRLARFSRLIIFDKRGAGLSDPVPVAQLPTIEERMDDLRAVMDAAGSETAALYGLADGGPLCMLFAAAYPHRTRALVLLGSGARLLVADDYPIGITSEQAQQFLDALERGWGTGVIVSLIAPHRRDDADFLRRIGRYERLSASPAMAVAVQRMNLLTDVRHVLPSIQAPTLVLSELGAFSEDHCRYLAQHIVGARLVEFPRSQEWSHAVSVGDVEEFLTGARQSPGGERILTTVLFTDIVGSTERAAGLGDDRWRDVLDAHDALVRRQLVRFRGTEIKASGDGFLATFDGPARAVRCAAALHEAVRAIGLELRVGVHTGEVEVRGDDIGGLAVHIASRVQALADPGGVLVTRTVTDLVVGSGLEFTALGEHELRGVPGRWSLYALALS